MEKALDVLSGMLVNSKRKEVVISLHRVSACGGIVDSSNADTKHLQEELAQAFSIIQVLKEENQRLKSGAPPQENAKKSVSESSDEKLGWDVLLDEDGKKWLKVSWNFSSFTPIEGDMLSLERLALHGLQKKTIQKIPCYGDSKGAALFDFPKGVMYCQFTYSRKGEEIAKSDCFCAGPQLDLSVESISADKVEIKWNPKQGYIPTASDWMALFATSDDRSYLSYDHIKLNDSHTLALPLTDKSRSSFVVKYFCSENKHVPITEIKFEKK